MVEKKRISKKVLFSKTIEILQPLLNLNDWTIVVKYSRAVGTKQLATCEARPEYKQAIIRLYIKNLVNLNDYDVICTAIHEMCHCLAWPIVEWTEDLCKNDKEKLKVTQRLEEGLVTNLEKILGGLTGQILQSKLSEDGYRDLDLVFEKFLTRFEKQKPKQK